MKHLLTQDERRSYARFACAGAGLSLAALGVGLWVAGGPAALERWWGDMTSASPPEVAWTQVAPGLATLAPVHVYGDRGGSDLDEFDRALSETTPSTPEGAMFAAGDPDATAAAEGAAPLLQHGALPSSDHEQGGAAAGSARHGSLGRGVRRVDVPTARAEDYNETVIKRASFRSCWELSPGASGKVSIKILVHPAHGVSATAAATWAVPDAVIGCVAAKARNLPLRVSPADGPRTFYLSSSYSARMM